MATNSSTFYYGTIKVYFPLKGFGFITREKGKDLFFYRTSVVDEASIIEGNPVKFRIETGDKGMRAIEIVRNG
jgi:CspA family cold shock protein